VIELRRAGLSVHEISARLRAESTPLNRTGVGQILTEEGFGRLIRSAAEQTSVNQATAGRDTGLRATRVIDFAALPDQADTAVAGLLLTIPDLVALDLPTLAKTAGYPGTRGVVPATSWLLPCSPSTSPAPAASATSTTCCVTRAAACSPAGR